MNALYTINTSPMLWGMAKLSKKLKAFRLQPQVALAVERAAEDLGKSQADIIEFCVAKSIAEVVNDQLRLNSNIVDESAFAAFKESLTAWHAFQKAESDKFAKAKPRRKRGKA